SRPCSLAARQPSNARANVEFGTCADLPVTQGRPQADAARKPRGLQFLSRERPRSEAVAVYARAVIECGVKDITTNESISRLCLALAHTKAAGAFGPPATQVSAPLPAMSSVGLDLYERALRRKNET